MSDPAIPEGLQLAHTFWGEPDTSVTHAHTAVTHAGPVQLAADSGVPYVPPPRDPRHCAGNDNRCMGWKVAGEDFCAGHLKLSNRKSVE